MRRLCLTLFAFALTAPAQSPTPHATYRIAGTVVSAIDNHPLQRAAIQLLDPEDQKPFQSTTSDEYGRFAFTGVPAGNHELQGTAPSYLATMYDEHEGFNTGIITGAGVDTESLVLKLRPASLIAGLVVDESAEPVQNATIHLFRQTYNFGDGRMVPAANVVTDDLGHFELPPLTPGTYFLAITATPWYAVHPNPQPQQQRFPVFGFADAIDPSLDVAYPAEFYPGTTDPARAAPIVLHGGESLDLHFQLSPVPAVTLTVPRSTAANGQSQSFPQLSISFLGQRLPSMGVANQTQTQFVITGVTPGDYVLTGINRPNGRADPGTPIHIGDRAMETTPPPASDLARVHVLLQSAHGAPLPPRLLVTLKQRHGDASAAQFSDEKNEVTLETAPGDSYFEIRNPQRPFAVLQILDANGRPLAANNIHLAAGDKLSFTVTLIPGIHTLKGVTRKDGKPFAGAFVLLFPSDQVGDIHTFFRQQSDLDGSFDIRSLAPGAYTLVAIENGWDLDWQHDGALARYLPKALTVHIPDTVDKVQHLPVPVEVQSR